MQNGDKQKGNLSQLQQKSIKSSLKREDVINSEDVRPYCDKTNDPQKSQRSNRSPINGIKSSIFSISSAALI